MQSCSFWSEKISTNLFFVEKFPRRGTRPEEKAGRRRSALPTRWISANWYRFPILSRYFSKNSVLR